MARNASGASQDGENILADGRVISSADVDSGGESH